MSLDDIIENLSTEGSNDVLLFFSIFHQVILRKENMVNWQMPKSVTSNGPKTTQARKRNMKRWEKRYGEQN